MLKLATRLDEAEQAAAVKVDAGVRKLAPKLRPAHIATWREAPVLSRDRGGPWVLVPLELDPLRTPGGGYPLPGEVSKELASIAATGVDFHRLAVAHEVSESSTVQRLLAKAGPAGVVITARQAASVIGKVPAPPELRSKVAGFDDKIRGLVSGAAQGLASAAALPFMLDPIIFGVLGVSGPPRDGRPALYYPLAAWEW